MYKVLSYNAILMYKILSYNILLMYEILSYNTVFMCKILFVGYLHVYFPKKDNPTCTFGTSSKDLVKSSSSTPPDWPKNKIKT